MNETDLENLKEEIEIIANKYGLYLDFYRGTIGNNTEIVFGLSNSV